MTQPQSQAEQFAAFQAWQASQAAQTPPPVPADERPTLSVFDVIKQLVTLAPVASETVQREYHAAIDEARKVWDSIVTPKPADTTPTAPNE